MKCPKCNHENVDAKFCEKCGTNLVDPALSMGKAASDSSTSSQESQPQSASVYLDKTKSAAKNYFRFFVNVLKKPYPASSILGQEYFINALITMILYAFIIPCILYFSIKGVFSQIEKQLEGNFFGGFMSEVAPSITPSFGDVVVTPFFGFIILIALVSIFAFTALKLAKITVDLKEIIARFGAFLIPFVVILLVSLILSILKIKLAFFVFIIGFLGSLLLVPAFVIFSYKKIAIDGLDLIYGTILSYVLTFIVLSIMGNMLFNSIASSLQQLFTSFGL
jgi:hypothetical protein